MQFNLWNILTNIFFFISFLHSTQAQQREKSYETIIMGGQTQYSNMTDFSHNYDVIGYRNGTKEERGS